MTARLSVPQTSAAKNYLEWSVVGVGAVSGTAIALTGVSYGLTNVTGVGAGFFPLVAGAIIALGSMLWAGQIIGETLRHRRENASANTDHPVERTIDRADPPTDTAIGVLVLDGNEEEDDEDASLPTRDGLRRVAMVVLALLAAAVVLPVLGYLVTMTLMLFAVMTLVSARRWWVALLIGFGAALASRFVFETLLDTALPHIGIDFLRAIGL